MDLDIPLKYRYGNASLGCSGGVHAHADAQGKRLLPGPVGPDIELPSRLRRDKLLDRYYSPGLLHEGLLSAGWD
jgi:hypothetical protein